MVWVTMPCSSWVAIWQRPWTCGPVLNQPIDFAATAGVCKLLVEPIDEDARCWKLFFNKRSQRSPIAHPYSNAGYSPYLRDLTQDSADSCPVSFGFTVSVGRNS